MTASLDDLFRAAKGCSGTWDHDDVQEALDILAGHECRVDWEPGDEEWGRILDKGGKVRALVCARLPVCIGLQGVDVGPLVNRVSWMTVGSMRDPVFEVDRRLLEEIFGRSLSENVDYSKLSIDDLWWATVS